jgi:hypothetical protein
MVLSRNFPIEDQEEGSRKYTMPLKVHYHWLLLQLLSVICKEPLNRFFSQWSRVWLCMTKPWWRTYGSVVKHDDMFVRNKLLETPTWEIRTFRKRLHCNDPELFTWVFWFRLCEFAGWKALLPNAPSFSYFFTSINSVKILSPWQLSNSSENCSVHCCAWLCQNQMSYFGYETCGRKDGHDLPMAFLF